jgi:hypothetical protein
MTQIKRKNGETERDKKWQREKENKKQEKDGRGNIYVYTGLVVADINRVLSFTG